MDTLELRDENVSFLRTIKNRTRGAEEVQDDKRLEPIIELHILMMLSCAPMLTRDKPTPSTKVRM